MQLTVQGSSSVDVLVLCFLRTVKYVNAVVNIYRNILDGRRTGERRLLRGK